MYPQYEDFFLIVNGTAGNYTVEAQGPGEIRVPPVPFEYRETDELQVELNRIKEGLAPTRERMQAAGALLFDALFPRRVIRAFERAPDVLPEGVSLRVKLIVRPPELSNLPWELLYDPDQEVFLAARLSYPIVRFIESGTPVASLLARRPLRVLYVQANPPDMVELNTRASERALRQALGADAEITSVHSTTPSALRDVLRERPGFHILHYDGHAEFDVESDAGYLYLHDEGGTSYRLGGEMLATYLDGTPVRLVVLSACETGVDSRQKRFSGIAHQLMRASSLPAVVAMQFEVADDAAIAFTRGFYRALADDYPVDAATIEGRKAILEILGGEAGAFAQPDWATPVLFMRSKDGDILREEIREDEANATAGSGIGVGEEKERESRRIDTGGGAYIGGRVDTGGGDFIGRDKVVHGDEVHGDKVGGDKITVGDITGSTGIAIGRAAQATVTTGLSGGDIGRLFAPLMNVLRDAPPEKRDEAMHKAEALKSEVAKGDKANDTRMAKLLDDLVELVPGAVSTVVSTFASPILGGIAGPVTRFVLEKIQGE